MNFSRLIIPSIYQQPRESVDDDFPHRFCDAQHQLQKILQNTQAKSKDEAGEDLEFICFHIQTK